MGYELRIYLRDIKHKREDEVVVAEYHLEKDSGDLDWGLIISNAKVLDLIKERIDEGFYIYDIDWDTRGKDIEDDEE